MAAVPKESRLKGLRDRTDVPTRFDQDDRPSFSRQTHHDDDSSGPSTSHQHHGQQQKGDEKRHHRQRHHTAHAAGPTSSNEVKRKWRTAQQRISYQESVNFFVRQDDPPSAEPPRQQQDPSEDDQETIIPQIEDLTDSVVSGPVQPPIFDFKKLLSNIIFRASSKLLFGQQTAGITNKEDVERGEEEEDFSRRRRRSKSGKKEEDDIFASSRGNWNRLQNRQRSMRLKTISNAGHQEGNTVIEDVDEGWPAVVASSKLSHSIHRHTLSPRDVQLDEADDADPAIIKFVPPMPSRGLDSGDVIGPHRLVIRLGTVKFKHHPLFSKEHVLAQEFLDLVSKATSHRKESNLHLRERVRQLRSAILDNQGDQNSTRFAKHELELAVKAREDNFIRHRTDLRAAMKAWLALRRQREDQGYVLTPHKLVVHVAKTDNQAAMRDWEAEIDSEARAVEREMLDEMQQAREDYERQQREEKAHDLLPPIPELPSAQAIRNMAEERVKNFMKSPEEPDITLEVSNDLPVTQKNDIKSRKEIARFKAIAKLRYSSKIFVNQKLVSETKPQPLLDASGFSVEFEEMVICHLHQSPDSIVVSIMESQNAAGRGKNKRELARVHLPLPRGEDVEEEAAEEDYGFVNETATSPAHGGVGSGVQFAVDTSEVTTEEEETEDRQVLSHKTLHTNGTITCSLGWATDKDGESTAPVEAKAADQHFLRDALASTDPISALGLEAALSKDKLLAWSKEQANNNPDFLPTDSRLGMLLSMNSQGEELDQQTPVGRCHLRNLDSELEFCSDEDLANDPRFRILRLRHHGIGQFKNLTFVPPTISSTNQHQPKVKTAMVMLKEHDKRRSHADGSPSATWEAAGLGRAAAHAKRLQLARESLHEWICKALETIQGRKSWEDVVYEESVPDIGVMGGKLLQPFAPRRPLKPSTVDRRPLNIDAHHTLTPHDIQLVVNVTQGAGLPARASGDGQCSPFVEVCFQELKAKTTRGEGNAPGWNEVLTLPMRAPKATDVITINVFDEVAVDILQDRRERGSTVHKRLEKFWLGSMDIRVSALLSQSRLEGVFCINTPPMLLGYYWPGVAPTGAPFGQDPRLSPAPRPTSPEQGGPSVIGSMASVRSNGGSASRESATTATHLRLFLTTEPPLTATESPMDATHPTEEKRHLFEGGLKWSANFTERYPKRKLTPFACDSSGKAVLVCRYIRPLPPPVDIIHQYQQEPSFLSKAKACAYFVSLIPHVPDLASGQSQITRTLWLTCDQFLASLAGDAHQHAVLLANYYLYLSNTMFPDEDGSADEKVNVKVVVGRGPADGTTTYVLTSQAKSLSASKHDKRKADVRVWTPMDGHCYSITDPFCPLSKIFFVFDALDVWANIQEDNSLARTSFDFNNSSCWTSLSASVKISSSNKKRGKDEQQLDLFSVQPPKLTYTPPDAALARELEKSLEATLKDKFMTWRKTERTQWNRHCTAVLRNSLVLLESSHGGLANQPHSAQLVEDYSERMRDLIGAYDLFGFPLHFSYKLNADDIASRLQSTRVHERTGPDLEFTLAVHAHPYPCGIFSVWVYIACLRSKNQ